MTQLFLSASLAQFLNLGVFLFSEYCEFFFKVVHCPLRFYLGIDFFFPYSFSKLLLMSERRVPVMIRKEECFPHFELL